MKIQLFYISPFEGFKTPDLNHLSSDKLNPRNNKAQSKHHKNTV